jgi:hypothetical protein
MQDYISADNAVIIPHTIQPFSIRLREQYRMYDLNTHYISAWDTYQALKQAAEMDEETYAKLSRSALATVRDKFGLAPFQGAIEQVIERATKRLGHQDRIR